MPKPFLVVKSLSASVLIESENEKDIRRLEASNFLKRYIPSYFLSTDKVKTDSVLSLKHGSNKIKIDFPSSIYSSREYDEHDIVSLIEYLLERGRQERGLYCLHGSASLINNKAVIFWGGASGMGKTSLCQKLKDDYRTNWLADEKIIINLKKMTVEGGVNVAYDKKNKFTTLNAKLSKSIPIAFMVYPFVSSPKTKELEFIKWDNKKFKWHLYEELNRKIRATSRIFFNDSEPVMPIDTIKLAKTRLKMIKLFVIKIRCYQLKGSSNKICQKVIGLTR